MKKGTLWQDGINFRKEIKIPTEEQVVDILIIGGGIAGITTFYQMRDAKEKILLIDKGHIGFGMTSKTTGKLTYLQELIYHKIEKTYDFAVAKKYLDAQREAIQFVTDTVARKKIRCNFERVDSYTFTNKTNELESFQKEETFLKKAGIPFQVMQDIPLKYPSIYALKVSDTAVFHPLKYLYRLAKLSTLGGHQIMEHVKAMDIDQDGDSYVVHTDCFKIRAKKIVVCTHYPFFIKPGYIPFKTHIEKSYLVAGVLPKTEAFSAITSSKPITSVRYHHDIIDYLLYGGLSHKTDKHYDTLENYQNMLKRFQDRFHLEPSYVWMAHDIMPDDDLPFIGPVHKNHPYIYIATGFRKWGMTNGTIAGLMIADMLKGITNRYETIFKPYRKLNTVRIMNEFVNGFTVMKSIIHAKLNRNPQFYCGRVKIFYCDGKRLASYLDEFKKEHIVSNVCPHMKCNLIFNTADKTWDCPCHGSRFDIDGKVIDGPSVYNIRIDEKK